MANYVTPLYTTNKMHKGKRVRYCQLFGENIDKLHSMALSLGIRRNMVREIRGVPIYDINERQRKLAIKLGVEPCVVSEAKYLMKNIKIDIEILEDRNV